MSDFIFLSPHWLWLLLLVPLWFVIIFYQQMQSRHDLQSFRKTPLTKTKQYLLQTLMCITLVALVLALAMPAWDPQPKNNETQGRDMVFLLDVSRSMLVNDARPTRLEVARQAIRNTVKASISDRFGLVVFAGSTSIQSPLTIDKTFFNYLLDQVNSHSVAQGGTRIEDALFKVLDKMAEKNQRNAMDIILISDGEDLDSQPERALAKLNEIGARLIVIGLGDSEFGGRIPARLGRGKLSSDNSNTAHQATAWQVYQGKEVWSKMHTDKLRTLAQGADQGLFVPVGTASFDLVKIIEKLRQVWPNKKQDENLELSYHQGYSYCLYLALLLQICAWLSGRHAWLTSLILLSFNSQAFTVINTINMTALSVSTASNTISDDSKKNESEGVSNSVSINNSSNQSPETLINTRPEALAILSTREQLLLAQSLFDASPEIAAQVYRYIASQAQQSTIAIQANFNLATSLIYYAEVLSQQLSLPAGLPNNLPDSLVEQVNKRFDDEHEFFDDDEYIDPEIYYDEASDILTRILLHSPKHLVSRQNLEWLTLRAAAQKNAADNPSSMQQKSAKSDAKDKNEKPEQKKDTAQEKSDSEQKQASQSQQSQQNESSAIQTNNISLPAPQASAEEIINQAKARNLTERAPQRKKQTDVERDW